MSILRKEKIGFIGFDNQDKLPFVIDNDVLSESELTAFNVVDNEDIPNAMLNGPIYLSLFPTLDCDKNCDFCFYFDLLNKNKDYKIMSFEIAEKTIKFCKKYGILSVNIIGGEPLLKGVWHTSKFLTKKLLENGVAVSLLSNGYNLNNCVQDLKQIQTDFPEQFNLVISTNPFDTKEKKYRDLESGLYSAEKNNLKFSINSIILNSNLDFYLDYFKELETKYKRVIKSFNLLYPRLTDDRRQSISEFIEFSNRIINGLTIQYEFEIPFPYKYSGHTSKISEIDKLNAGCGIGRRTLALAPNGDFFACDCFVSVNEFKLGNLDDKLSFIWNNAIKIREKHNLKITPTSCMNHCEFYEVCDGCLAEKIKDVNPKCEFIIT